MMSLLVRIAANALGIWLATVLLPGGVVIDSLTAMPGWVTLGMAALVLALVNAIVRPLLFIITLPIVLVSLGLFVFVLNAATFGLASVFLPGLHVHGFVAALVGGLLVSIANWALHLVFRRKTQRKRQLARASRGSFEVINVRKTPSP